MNAPKRLFQILFVLFVLSAGEVTAQNTVSIVATSDNTLFESAGGASSSGHGVDLFSGRSGSNASGLKKRAVLRFDLSGQLPVGAVVQSVELKLKLNKTNAGVGAQVFNLHKLASDWGEGASDASRSGAGAAAETGDATWLHSVYPDNFWTVPGGDFVSVSSGSQTADGVGVYQWGSTDEMVADVQAWVDTPEANFGWILIGNEAVNQTSKRFSSREDPVEANRPVLMVTFSSTTGVADEDDSIPSDFRLDQNYPNPFNPATSIKFSLSRAQHVTLTVFDIMGREVTVLVDAVYAIGDHEVMFSAYDLPSGTYVYRMTTAGAETSKKMTLLK
jgi:hypothetical protein